MKQKQKNKHKPTQKNTVTRKNSQTLTSTNKQKHRQTDKHDTIKQTRHKNPVKMLKTRNIFARAPACLDARAYGWTHAWTDARKEGSSY